MDKIVIRDKRRKNFYTIDNIVHDDKEITLHALGVYNSMARFANNETQKCYFSITWFQNKFKVGRNKVMDAIKYLSENEYISIDRARGRLAKVVLLDTSKKGVVSYKSKDVSYKTARSIIKDINNTDKQNLKNNTNNDPLYIFIKDYFFMKFKQIHGKKWSWAEPAKCDSQIKRLMKIAKSESENPIEEIKSKGEILEKKIEKQKGDYYIFLPYCMSDNWDKLIDNSDSYEKHLERTRINRIE
jgi:hypothetical protein